MPFVRVRDNEPAEIALRRFKRACEKAGVLGEVRERERYEKPTTVRKRKKAAAVKRFRKKMLREDPLLARVRELAKNGKLDRRVKDVDCFDR